MRRSASVVYLAKNGQQIAQLFFAYTTRAVRPFHFIPASVTTLVSGAWARATTSASVVVMNVW